MGDDDGEDDGEPRRRSGEERTTDESYKKAPAGWPAEPRGSQPPLSLGRPITTTQVIPPQMQSENAPGQSANLGLDSITLGQLRSMVGSAPKPKVFGVQIL